MQELQAAEEPQLVHERAMKDCAVLLLRGLEKFEAREGVTPWAELVVGLDGHNSTDSQLLPREKVAH
jgi:hypothetical protein